MDKLSFIFFFFTIISLSFSSVVKPKEIIQRSEYLDADERFLAEWEVDFDSKIITFDLTVQTTGYVGFGISPGPNMAGSDIFIGGIKGEDAMPYYNDYHSEENGRPVEDVHSDWEFVSGSEVNGVTRLKIKRALDTCDTEDVEITEDTQNLIWAIGTTDEIGYHDQGNRGPRTINVLDPPTPPVDTSEFQVWRINHTMNIPAKDTTYWCTVHRAPNFNGTKHHIIGFKTFLDGELGRKYTHHATVSMCRPPQGSSAEEAFERFIGHPGSDCFEEGTEMPVDLCQSIMYIWAVGGEPLFLPEQAGYPIGETDDKIYIMYEVHYDNKDLVTNATFDTAAEIYYTNVTRDVEAAILTMLHNVSPFQTIPPLSPNFVTIGHCDPTQTRMQFRDDFVLVFNAMLHAHTAAKAMKLRLFRDKEELPWLASDLHYDFNYQANRPYKNYRELFPGDHLTIECTYDTSERTGVTLGGYPSRYEMCQAHLWVLPNSGSGGNMACMSEVDNAFLGLFGIEAYNYSGVAIDDVIITKPEELAGRKYQDVLNSLEWTNELKEKLQQAQRYAPHLTRAGDKVGYPEIDKPWAPTPKECGSPSGAIQIVTGNFMVIAIGSLLTKLTYFI